LGVRVNAVLVLVVEEPSLVDAVLDLVLEKFRVKLIFSGTGCEVSCIVRLLDALTRGSPDCGGHPSKED
jgi:hypothetical protein